MTAMMVMAIKLSSLWTVKNSNWSELTDSTRSAPKASKQTETRALLRWLIALDGCSMEKCDYLVNEQCLWTKLIKYSLRYYPSRCRRRRRRSHYNRPSGGRIDPHWHNKDDNSFFSTPKLNVWHMKRIRLVTLNNEMQTVAASYCLEILAVCEQNQSKCSFSVGVCI